MSYTVLYLSFAHHNRNTLEGLFWSAGSLSAAPPDLHISDSSSLLDSPDPLTSQGSEVEAQSCVEAENYTNEQT